MNNQNGFATLEIILIVGIIAIFSTVAVPKMARILDKVCLDYEMKHLYSDLNFARSIGKSSSFNAGIFTDINNSDGETGFWLYNNSYITVTSRNHYQIMRTALTSSPYYRHNLSNGITLSFKSNSGYRQPLKINCYKLGNKETFILTSKFGDNAYVFLNTVGRARGSYYEK